MEAPNRMATERSELKANLESVVEKVEEVCDRLEDQTAAAVLDGRIFLG